MSNAHLGHGIEVLSLDHCLAKMSFPIGLSMLNYVDATKANRDPAKADQDAFRPTLEWAIGPMMGDMTTLSFVEALEGEIGIHAMRSPLGR